MKTGIHATHTRPDIDSAVASYLHSRFGPSGKKDVKFLFLRAANDALTRFGNVDVFDTGRGPFDHHQRRLPKEETSASLVAKACGVEDNKTVQKLLGLVMRTDRAGESLPFDISKISKCLQRNFQFSDEEVIRLDLQIIHDVMEFSDKRLERDNQWVQMLVVRFLARKKKKPKEFIQYIERLGNKRFQRICDLVEIAVAEKARVGEVEAVRFTEKILEVIYFDLVTLFDYAVKDALNSPRKKINGIMIVYDYSDNAKYNTACRVIHNAMIIIQRNSARQTQIYFNTKKIDLLLPDILISVIRLEECLIRGREVPRIDLGRRDTIEEIPEWHYFEPPKIGNRKPGRFIFNGSFTAPDVPRSEIPFKLLVEIVMMAVWRYPRFNWNKWKNERMACYMARRINQRPKRSQ